MLSLVLKENTKHPHALLEKIIIHKIKNLNSKEDYVQLLRMFYGFFSNVEAKIAVHIDQQLMRDFHARRKTGSLLNDIHLLTNSGQKLSSGNIKSLPLIDNHLHALGAMYVMEGSTLGGSIISEMIQQKLQLGDDKALSFFKSYGEETEVMWARFKKVLNDMNLNDEQSAEVVDAANNTFTAFKNFIENEFEPVEI